MNKPALAYPRLYWMGIAFYAFLFLAKKQWFHLPSWITSYGGDALCMTLFLSTVVAIMRKVKHAPELNLSIGMIIFATLQIILVFEWLLPKISSRYTADVWDAVLYSIGAVLFYFFHQNKNDVTTSLR